MAGKPSRTGSDRTLNDAAQSVIVLEVLEGQISAAEAARKYGFNPEPVPHLG